MSETNLNYPAAITKVMVIKKLIEFLKTLVFRITDFSYTYIQ